eukprot:SAG31_NODE_175_length_21352_cov_3.981508_17_plen_221_part_00
MPLLENYGSLAGQMGTGSWTSKSPKRDGDFRNGIPFGPIGNMLSYSGHFNPPSSMTSGLWLGTVTAELYYSAGWIAVDFVNMTTAGYTSAVSEYALGLKEFKPHILGRFGNTKLDVQVTNATHLRARAWYDADTNTAVVAVVNGADESVNFAASIMQAFNHRVSLSVFTSFVAQSCICPTELENVVVGLDDLRHFQRKRKWGRHRAPSHKWQCVNSLVEY